MSTETCDLRQGDVVALVGETDQGLIRGRACVLGQTAPDWYAGELEDGSRVEFRIDQVEGVETEYGMSGFLDWFKKKPVQESRALIPTGESEGIIFVGPTGVAKYEEPKPAKKGFLKPIAEAVKAFFTSSEGGSSIFDIFKTTTALIPEPEKEAVKFEKAASIFSQFVPPEKSLETIAEKISALIPPEGPGPLAPYIEAAERTFEHIKPSAPIVPYEEQKARQMEIWTEMFEESKEEAPLYEAFAPGTKASPAELRPFEESEVVSEKKFVKAHPFDWDRGLSWDPVVMELPASNEMLPSANDLARAFLSYWGPELFEDIFEQRNEEFENGEEYFIMPIQSIGSGEGIPDYYEGISMFLQISWSEFEKRAGGNLEDADDDEEGSLVWKEIVYPAYRRIEEAFKLIQPRELPGEILVGHDPSWGNQNVIAYIERNPALPMEEDGEHDFAQSRDWEAEEEAEDEAYTPEVHEAIEEKLKEVVRQMPKKKPVKKAKKKKKKATVKAR